MSTARHHPGKMRRLIAAGLLGLGLFLVSPGCGLFVESKDPATPHWGPRPLQRWRDKNRDRELRRAIEHDKFPRAEQVGIKPAESKSNADE